MKHKTSELSGALLDVAVAKAEGLIWDGVVERMRVLDLPTSDEYTDEFISVCGPDRKFKRFSPSSDWAHGGPIIDRERISLLHSDNHPSGYPWMALKGSASGHGLTAQVAAMRAYVAHKLGDEVEL
jgi:hypothetical protein